MLETKNNFRRYAKCVHSIPVYGVLILIIALIFITSFYNLLYAASTPVKLGKSYLRDDIVQNVTKYVINNSERIPITSSIQENNMEDEYLQELNYTQEEKERFQELNKKYSPMYGTGCDFSAAISAFHPEELEINCNNIHQLKPKKLIGKGNYREVYKAKWNDKPVAMKVMRKNQESEICQFQNMREAVTMFALRGESKTVQLLGWCNNTIVTEWIPTELDHITTRPKYENITVLRALEIARDAAMGVAQLHKHGFTHHDILSRQFLVRDIGEVVLNDFNLAEYTGPRGEYTITPDWLRASQKCKFTSHRDKTSITKSPEQYMRNPLDEKSDIYSLSLIFWELRSRTYAYTNNGKDYEENMVAVLSGERPPLESASDYPIDMQNLISEMWAQEPNDRPTAMEAVLRIEKIIDTFTRMLD